MWVKATSLDFSESFKYFKKKILKQAVSAWTQGIWDPAGLSSFSGKHWCVCSSNLFALHLLLSHPSVCFPVWTFHLSLLILPLLFFLLLIPPLLSCPMWRCGSRRGRSIVLRATGAGVGSVRPMCSGFSRCFLGTPTPTTAKNWKVRNETSWSLYFSDFKFSLMLRGVIIYTSDSTLLDRQHRSFVFLIIHTDSLLWSCCQ